VSGQLPIYPQGKSPWYPLCRRLGGPQSRCGLGGEEKNSQLLPGLGSPDHQTLLRKIFGPKREEVAGVWRRLHNEELHNVYASRNIVGCLNQGL
jgi:hypothetical protein